MIAVNMETYKYNSTFSLSEYWRIFASYTNLGFASVCILLTSEYSPVFTSASGTIVYLVSSLYGGHLHYVVCMVGIQFVWYSTD